MRPAIGIAWFLAVALTGSAAAQGMGEAAAKEKKRREALKAAGKAASSETKTLPGGDVKTDPAAEGAAGSEPDDSGATTPRDEGKRVRAAEIRRSLEACHVSLTAARAALKAAETAPALVARPGDDPFHEEPAAEEPPAEEPPPTDGPRTAAPPPPPPTKEQKVQDAKALVASLEQQCDDIEDGARKEGIPPGWIR